MAAKARLTKRQGEILEFIRQRITRGGQPPTIREIGSKFGIKSTNGVRGHLSALIHKGFLRKQALVSRGLGLSDGFSASPSVGRVPLVGSVPAGVPIDAVENIEGEVAVDFTFLPQGDCFTLRVQGDSMKDAGIFDGDLILVRKQDQADRGEIVVAVINGEATVKRFFPGEDGRIRLQPENASFKPIVVSHSDGDFHLAGKVVGLLRRIG